MSEFNWNDHPIVTPGAAPAAAGTKAFSWDDHPVVKAASPANTGPAQTALESFGNGISFGHLPQLQAAAEKGVDAIGDLKDKALQTVGLDQLTSIDAQLRKQGFKLPDSSYVQIRDADIKRQEAQNKENPATAAIANGAGIVATGVATAPLLPELPAGTAFAAKIARGVAQGAGTGAVYGALQNPGDTESVVDPLQASKRVANAETAAKFGGAIGGAAPLVAAGASKAASMLAPKLQASAEKMAVNATGATGKQAANFQDNAGRELLDRGIVRFGDDQATIAKRASDAVDAANKQIDDALTSLKAKGVTVDGEKIKQAIADKITRMKGDPSQSDVVKLLNSELQNLTDAAEAKGNSTFAIDDAERVKRGYNRKAGNWADPEKGAAGKEMYQQFRTAVESAATESDPETAALFEKGKKAYGTLAPIQEAAERRAATTAQSPAGGMLDTGAAAVGFMKGGPIGAILAPIARRIIAPRLASMGAVTADKAASLLMKIPEFADLANTQPSAFQALVSHVVAPAEEVSAKVATGKTKGPDKWANDGHDNLLDHVGTPQDQELLEKNKGALVSDPKTKQLLIQASDLKPGTPAMAKVMAKVKAKIASDE